MTVTLFVVALVAEVLTAAAVCFSLAFPDRRAWPPPRQLSWQAVLIWVLFFVAGGGLIALGVLDWGNWALPPWMRWAVGAPLFLAGHSLALWAIGTLGLVRTLGSAGTLVRRGPYRFTRNPQYVGYSAALIGWALLSSSALTLLAALGGVIVFILAPRAEEPWLLSRYGPAYEEYRRAVPRFIPWRRRGGAA